MLNPPWGAPTNSVRLMIRIGISHWGQHPVIG